MKEPISDKLKTLGFTSEDGIAGCCTIPCFGGKMPWQAQPVTPCAIIQSMCNKSPIWHMKHSEGSNESTNKKHQS